MAADEAKTIKKKEQWVVGSTLEYARARALEIGVPGTRCRSVDNAADIPAGAEIVVARMGGDRSNLWSTVDKESKQ